MIFVRGPCLGTARACRAAGMMQSEFGDHIIEVMIEGVFLSFFRSGWPFVIIISRIVLYYYYWTFIRGLGPRASLAS